MKIKLNHITVRELVDGYTNDGEGGVRGYSGKLDIRPPFQREYVYEGKQRDAVINTLLKGFPLNTMYWAVRDDGTYEVIDGQQRTVSVAEYIVRNLPFKGEFFDPRKDKFRDVLDYEFTVYFCEGTDEEKLEWFEIINIAGIELERQELRNAVYTGTWLMDAKRHFSKTGCAAWRIGQDYMNGKPIRQHYLETVIGWIVGSKDDEKIREYMSFHQYDPDANELWSYFESLIDWVDSTFSKTGVKFMKGLDWGSLYDKHKDKSLDPTELKEEIQQLILDKDVTNNRGIYQYVLTRDERYLNIRAFDDDMKPSVPIKGETVSYIK